jgi:hypothetical protein
MFTIISNASGFHVADRIPNDTKMNSAYFDTNILTPLEQAISPQRTASHQKQLVIHLDIVWSISISASLPSWALGFRIQIEISLSCGAFRK